MKGKLLKGFLAIIIVFAILFGGFIGYIAITDYKPEDITPLAVDNNSKDTLTSKEDFTITTFNVGYFGLDRNADFFMDGGEMSLAASKEITEKNIKEVSEFIKKDNSDFYFFQEVDRKSRRSYNIDQYNKLKDTLNLYSSTFATNYKVGWVPMPITEQHGNVYAGMATFSKYNFNSGKRYSLPGKDKWLKQLFLLDRCVVETVVPTDNGKNLILLNVHLSAYDKSGKIRNQQVNFLKNYMKRHKELGNYIVIGGDWNHLLTKNINTKKEEYKGYWPEWLKTLPKDFLADGFKWAIDEKVDTCRELNAPYDEEKTFTTVIDGFIISDNIELVNIKGQDLNFDNSDHNPVEVTLKLK